MKTGSVAASLLTAALLLAAGSAQAIWPFGDSQATKAAALESKANTQLQAADEAWRVGDLSKASGLYQMAAETYRDADKMSPGLDNGLVRFRLSYCLGQVEQINNAGKDTPKTEKRVAVTHPPADDGAALPAAGADRGPASGPVNVRRELADAQELLASDHPEDALTPLIKVLRAEPDNRRALLLMATVRVQQGRYADAIVPLESLRGPNEDEAVLMLAAGAYCGAGRYFDALLALDKVLKMNPDLPQAHLNMAYLLLEMSPEKRNDADMYYQHALKLGMPRDALLEKRLGRK